MSETLLNFIIVFSELGVGLLLALIGWVVYYICGEKKEGRTTVELIRHIKAIIPVHKNKLANHFADDDEVEQNKTDLKVKGLIENERKIYERLINVSVSKDTSMLKLTVDDINTLINDYVNMLTLKGNGNELSSQDGDSHELILRKENEALRLENSSLQTRLALSEETIENMMGEFSSMYEGGKKEGEQRLKNEMYQLKQSLNEEESKVKAGLKVLDKDMEEDKNE